MLLYFKDKMKKLLDAFTTKKVDINDVVSPKPSKSAMKVLKVALQKSYAEQQTVRKQATAIRGH